MTRGYLTDRERREILEAQDGKCAAPGCDCEGPFQDDHSTPNALAPGKPDQLLCVPCHKQKTRRDVAAIAKAKRLSGEKPSQWSRRQERGPQLRSRGFQKRNAPRSADDIFGKR